MLHVLDYQQCQREEDGGEIKDIFLNPIYFRHRWSLIFLNFIFHLKDWLELWQEHRTDKHLFPIIDQNSDYRQEWEESWPQQPQRAEPQERPNLFFKAGKCLLGLLLPSCFPLQRVWMSSWCYKSHSGQASHCPHLHCLLSLFTHLGRKSFVITYCHFLCACA